MAIGSIPSMNSMFGMQTTVTNASNLKDQKSKNIQNEIADVQQKMQKLSSEEELTVTEKANEKKKLQKEISGLNTELKQHQEELCRTQKREIMLARMQEETKSEQETSSAQEPAKEQQTGQPGTVIYKSSDGTVILMEEMNQPEKAGTNPEKVSTDENTEENIDEKETEPIDSDTDTGFSYKEMQAMVSADSSLQQADRQGAVTAGTNNDIAVLEGEIRQDKRRDVNTDQKQAELKEMEKRKQRELKFQFAILGRANDAFADEWKVSQKEQENQQQFYVSIG